MPGPMDDLALSLVRHGYRAVERRREAAGGGDDFQDTMLGRRCLVLRSSDGVRCFYDESLVRRTGAVPAPLKNLLFGRGAVHGLDDDQHARRKQMFRDALDDSLATTAVDVASAELSRRARTWERGGVVVFDELVASYGAGALTWAGLDPSPEELAWVPRELARIVDGFGGSMPAYPRAWVARKRTDGWLAARVADVRSGRRSAPRGSPLQVVADSPLPEPVAAVELGNLVRPTVAVAWLGTSAALHLARLPQWRERLATDAVGREHLAFAQEVRRTTPFVPVLAGVARRPATISGLPVAAGDRLVLDVWGVDTDPTRWPDPLVVDPGRFVDRSPDAFEMMPQGGGDVRGHRCPGESLTLRLLAATVQVLAGADYRIDGPVGVDLSRMPTLPGGGLALAPAGARLAGWTRWTGRQNLLRPQG
jgi:fatty-acid peroxygenase